MIEREYYERCYGDNAPEEYVCKTFLANPHEMRRFQMVVDAIPRETQSVLDVGCGSGILLRLLREQRPAVRTTGLERSSTSVSTARRMFGVDVVEGFC